MTAAEKLKSRKFWVSFATLVVIAFAKSLGLEFDDASVWALAGTASSYVLGQSIVDRSLVLPPGKPDSE